MPVEQQVRRRQPNVLPRRSNKTNGIVGRVSVKCALPELGGLFEGVASQQIPSPLGLRLTAALRPAEVRRPLQGGKAVKAATLGLFQARPREPPLVDQVIDVLDPGPDEGGLLETLKDLPLSPVDLFLAFPWLENLEKC